MHERSEQLRKERPLVSAIRNGNTSAWGQLYDFYAPLLYRQVLMPRLADPTAAEDALSETFRTAIERFHQYKDHEAGIYPWLSRIAHNKAMDLHRARAMTGRKIMDLSHLLAPLMASVKGADELLELKMDQMEMSARMNACLAHLNPRYRRVLELRFLEETSRESCALLLEIKVGTLDVLVLRAVRSLQKAWQESLEAPDGRF